MHFSAVRIARFLVPEFTHAFWCASCCSVFSTRVHTCFLVRFVLLGLQYPSSHMLFSAVRVARSLVPEFTHAFQCGSCCSVFSFLSSVLQMIVFPLSFFFSFGHCIVHHVCPSDYPICIFKLLNKHITNSNIFFTLIDGRGIGITFGTQITFTFLEFSFFYSFFFIFCMHAFFVEKKF